MPPKLFFCEYAACELPSFVDLLHYLDHGPITRHVFDLDVVCHVGEMTPAPADVLKGAAGKENHGANAKARPAVYTRRHTVQASMFIQHSDTLKTKQTHPKTRTTLERTRTSKRKTFSADNSPAAHTTIWS